MVGILPKILKELRMKLFSLFLNIDLILTYRLWRWWWIKVNKLEKLWVNSNFTSMCTCMYIHTYVSSSSLPGES